MLLSGLACLGMSGERVSVAQGADPDGAAVGELVVYCSADAVYAKPVLAAFERETGIRLRPVFDTEATKTFGLVQRLINEKDSPRADVFLSSEAMGMIRLARAGVLEPYTSAAAEEAFASSGGWPSMLRARDGTWYGFARRVRVMVCNTRHIADRDVPQRLADLTHERFKGRIGIARPEFGTTRGHMGALLMSAGEEAFTAWCEGLKANGVRMYDGNMSVVRAVGRGEVHIGLTDTDDVYAGLANDWPLAGFARSDHLVANTHDRAPASTTAGESEGGEMASPMLLVPYPERAMQMPHTVAIVRGTRNRAAAERFVDYMLGREADRLFSEGDARTYLTFMRSTLESGGGEDDATGRGRSVRAGTEGMPRVDALAMMDLDLERATDMTDRALDIWNRVMSGR